MKKLIEMDSSEDEQEIKTINFVKASKATESDSESSVEIPRNRDEEEEEMGATMFPASFGIQNHQPLASFEKYTKGIGSKLLLKMGYKPGQGLGADGHGIVEPIDVKQRPQGMGLGHGGFDERTAAVKREKRAISKDQDVDFVKEKPRWKKATAKKRKRIFKSASELLAEQASLPPPTVASITTKVTDMTGKSVKVTDMQNLSIKRIGELVYNVRLLSDLSQNDLLVLSRKIRIEKLQMDKESENLKALQEHMDQEDQLLKKQQGILEILGKIRLLSNTDYDLDDFAAFQNLFSLIDSEDYKAHGLDRLFCAILKPAFEKLYRDWNPLEDPGRGTNFLLLNKEYLVVKAEISQNTMSPYETLLYNYFLPRVRHDLINNWDVLNPDPCCRVLETWNELIPRWLWQNIVYQVLLPKLSRTLDDIPVKQSKDINKWIFPFLPLISNEMKELLVSARRKLQQFFKSWVPTDKMGYKIVLLWIDVLEEQEMDELIQRSVVPRIRDYMEGFVVNPSNQDMQMIQTIVKWKEIMHADIFSQCFEPVMTKWKQALWIWLDSPNANLEQVASWYSSWKLFFQELKVDHLPSIKDGLQQGLDMMNQGTGAKIFLQSSTKAEAPKKEQYLAHTGFQDLVEYEAMQHDIVFVPVNRMHNNKPIYKLGKLHVILDDNVLFGLIDGRYKPMSIEEALERGKQ